MKGGIMSSFTNYPVLISESMNPFDVSIAFKCEKCGRISKTLNHICYEEGEILIVREGILKKIKKLFKPVKKLNPVEI